GEVALSRQRAHGHAAAEREEVVAMRAALDLTQLRRARIHGAQARIAVGETARLGAERAQARLMAEPAHARLIGAEAGRSPDRRIDVRRDARALRDRSRPECRPLWRNETIGPDRQRAFAQRLDRSLRGRGLLLCAMILRQDLRVRMVGRADRDGGDEQRGRNRRRALPDRPAVGRHEVPRRHMCAEITATLGDAPARRSGRPAYSYGNWVSVPLLIELARIGVAEQRAGPRQRIGLAVLLILVLRLGVLLRIIRIAIGGLVRAVA